MDVKSKKVQKTLPFSLDRISSPDWSPTGSHIAFAGLEDGMANIYVYDFKKQDLRKLTSDSTADDRPSFSADGQKLVFESEYGAGRDMGCRGLDLFTINLDGTGLQRITDSPFDDHMACFSSDGKHVYFISNRSGINNLYVTPLDSLSPKPLTNVFCGCFTPSLPKNGKFIVFSVFENGGWDVFRMEDPLSHAHESPLPVTRYVRSLTDTGFVFWKKYEPVKTPKDTAAADSLRTEADSLRTDTDSLHEGTDSILATADSLREGTDSLHAADSLHVKTDSLRKDTTARGDTLAAVADSLDEEDEFYPDPFDPYGRRDPFNNDPFYRTRRPRRKPPPVDTSEFIHDSTVYKEPGGAYREHPYTPRFTFDAISAMIGVGASPNNVAMAGQTAFSLSDILGNHHIDIMANIYGTSFENALDAFNGYLSYYYLPYRPDFGMILYRYVNWFGEEDDSELIYRLYFDAVHNAGVGVSSLGLTFITRRIEVYERASIDEGYLHRGRDPSASMQNYEVGLGGVFDNTFWGHVGPVNGQRMNLSLKLAPPTGSSDYSYGTAVLDARKYFHFVKKFVLALRFTAGASAPVFGGENPHRFYLGGVPGNVKYIFMPYFIDNTIESNYYASVIMPLRGYSLGAANPLGNTQFALSNLEFRFPFVRNLTFYFPFPFSIQYIMGAVFWDAGAAWERLGDLDPVINEPGFSFTFKDIKSGVGFGLRLNLFGALVLKWDRALRLGEEHVTEDYFSLGAEF
jgi:hypothetical protein